LSIPFIFLGGATQIGVQHESEKGWREQKRIWQQMFEIAPDLIPGTNVILLLPKYDNSLGAKPFQSGTWGFRSALALLYGHEEIEGFFSYFGMRKSLEFTEEGIIRLARRDSPIVPYHQALLFRYERNTGNLELITELHPSTTRMARPINDLCAGCILTQSEPRSNLRWLVK
jgi:hypothetical protein